MISSLIRHADRHHGDVEIVSRRVEGDIHRTTYRELHSRAKRLANALDALGVGMSDRVATLAWNGYRHMELYYGVAGKGADRAHDQSAPARGPDRVDHPACRRHPAVLRPDVPADRREDRGAMPDDQGVRRDDRRGAHAGDDVDPRSAVLRGPARCAERSLRLADVRRASGVVDVLHVGHDRQSQGRAVQSPVDAAAHVRSRASRCDVVLGARRDPARSADVPRQRLGHSLRGGDDGREARVPRRGARRQVAARTDRSREGHGVGGRAHGLARPPRLHGAKRSRLFDDAAHDHRRRGAAPRNAAHLRGEARRGRLARMGHDRAVAARHRMRSAPCARRARPRGRCTASRASRAVRSSAST